ncbi:hypothetical protein LCGC14_0691040 [marine sediment metagenome]|uniref:Antitoxin SocA-like Panacea domain-containing protein n=1 Tax=marine sediment metagenome TaxID=412755 RepID=A0A0F9TTB8_9ZZZZ
MKPSYKKIIAVLKYLGFSIEKSGGPDVSFNSRFKIQKIAYLCKGLGIEIYHKFNIRVHGPYSHVLAQDYYHFPEAFVNLETDYVLTESERQIANEIKENVLDHYITKDYETELLEAVSTIIYLKKENPDISDDDIFATVKKMKSHLKESMIIISNNISKELLFKPEYLTEEIRNELDMWDNID